jgi:hypothetical protein
MFLVLKASFSRLEPAGEEALGERTLRDHQYGVIGDTPRIRAAARESIVDHGSNLAGGDHVCGRLLAFVGLHGG